MKKYLFFFLIFSSTLLYAQDKDLQATAYYIKAEAAYNNNNFNETVSYLNQAETLLGGPNQKTLYLKIYALNELTQNSSSRMTELKQALETFFDIVDKNTYSTEKYLEITNIFLEQKEREQKMKEEAQAEEALFKEEAQAEEALFKYVKESTNLDDVNGFLNRYPNSKFIPQLGDKINALRERTEQRRVEEEKRVLDAKKSVKPQGFYMSLGFSLQNTDEIFQPFNNRFMAKGFNFDLGFKTFGYRNLDKKFRVGFDLGLFSYTYAMSDYYSDTYYDYFTGQYTRDRAILYATLQFLKMGPIFMWNLKKSQHFLYFTPQIGGNFALYDIPGFYGNVLGLGATGGFKLEYLYRKLLIGIKYQYNFVYDFESESLLGGHQIVVPTIGVKF